jgi:2-methylisocitrate lyase-like PEP mutase family enzyme
MSQASTPGEQLRTALQTAREQQRVLPFVGIYDLFSASLAAERFEALFLSGFGLAASAYGLPDIGFISWGDLTAITSRLRALLPEHHLLVDVDDGFGDPAVASHVARCLERCGASGVVLEDQARPRRCGHLDGKRLLPLADYVAKLEAVLQSRSSLVVVARTDASDPDEILRRVQAYVEAGCDAVLADGVRDTDLITQLSRMVNCPVFCNVIGGGKVPAGSRADLAIGGVQGLIYSTPCLFAAQDAIEQTLQQLIRDDVPLADALAGARDLSDCHAVLDANLERAGAWRA